MATVAQSSTPSLHLPTVPSLSRQAVRYSVIGVACAVVSLALYALLREWLDPVTANVVASLVVTIANTAANRRFTFGVHGGNRAREQAQGLVLFALSLGLSSGALWLLGAVTVPDRLTEMVVLVAANLVGGLLRFAFLRSWVFRTP